MVNHVEQTMLQRKNMFFLFYIIFYMSDISPHLTRGNFEINAILGPFDPILGPTDPR